MELTDIEVKTLTQIADRIFTPGSYANLIAAAIQLDGYISRLIAKGRDASDIDEVLGDTGYGEPLSLFVSKINR